MKEHSVIRAHGDDGTVAVIYHISQAQRSLSVLTTSSDLSFKPQAGEPGWFLHPHLSEIRRPELRRQYLIPASLPSEATPYLEVLVGKCGDSRITLRLSIA